MFTVYLAHTEQHRYTNFDDQVHAFGAILKLLPIRGLYPKELSNGTWNGIFISVEYGRQPVFVGYPVHLKMARINYRYLDVFKIKTTKYDMEQLQRKGT